MRPSHWGPAVEQAVSTMRRCMVPSFSIRVTMTLTSLFCPHPDKR